MPGVDGCLTSQTMFDSSLTPLGDLSSSTESHSMDPNSEGVLKTSFIALNWCIFKAIEFSPGPLLHKQFHFVLVPLCQGLAVSCVQSWSTERSWVGWGLL